MSSLGITPPTTTASPNSTSDSNDHHPWEPFGYVPMTDDNDASRSTSIETSTTTTTSSSHPSTSTAPRRYSLSSSLSPIHTTSSLQPLDHCQTSRCMINKDSISQSSPRRQQQQQHRQRRRSPPPPPVITNADYYNQHQNIHSPRRSSQPLLSSPYDEAQALTRHSLPSQPPTTPSPRPNRRIRSSPDDADKAAGGTVSIVSSPPPASPTTPRRSSSIAPSLADRIRRFEDPSSPRSPSIVELRQRHLCRNEVKETIPAVSSPRSPQGRLKKSETVRQEPRVDVRVDVVDEERVVKETTLLTPSPRSRLKKSETLQQPPKQRPPPSSRFWKESPKSSAAEATTAERDDGRDEEEGGGEGGDARREECVKLSLNPPSPRDPAPPTPPPRRRLPSIPTSPTTTPSPRSSVVATVLSQMEPHRLKSPRKDGSPSVAAMAKLFTKTETPKRRPSSTVAQCRSMFEGGEGGKGTKRWTREGDTRRSVTLGSGTGSVGRRVRSASLPRLSIGSNSVDNGSFCDVKSPRTSRTASNTPVGGGGRHWESPRSKLPPRSVGQQQMQQHPPTPPMPPRRATVEGTGNPTTTTQEQQQRSMTTVTSAAAAAEPKRLPHVISVDSQSDGFDSCSSVSSSSYK